MPGFTGISFPFRIGNKGGVVTSSTSITDISHILESMKQIIGTRRYERSMEYHIYSDVDTSIFEPGDSSLFNLISYEVKKCLKLEPRIEVVSVETYQNGSNIYSTIIFKVLKYDTVYTEDMKVGEFSNVPTSK